MGNGGARKPVNTLWRGSLLPLGSEAAQIPSPRSFRHVAIGLVGAAAQPSGSKLPRHRVRGHMGKWYRAGSAWLLARL